MKKIVVKGTTKRSWKQILLSMGMLIVIGVLHADEYTPHFSIPDGGMFVVPGIMQTGNSATNTSSWDITKVVMALRDATIKVTRPDGKTEGALYFTTVATNGTLTLDVTEWDGYPFRIDGGIIANGNGALVVKGRDSITIGYGQHDVRSGFGESASQTLRSTSRPAAFRNVTFVDSTGTPYVTPAGITLSGAFWDAGISTNATCPWTVAADTVVSVDFKHGFIERYASAEGLNVDTFDLWLLNSSAIAGIPTVCVSPGRNFRIVPRTVRSYNDSNGKPIRNFGWDGLIQSPYNDFTNNVELLGEGACFTLSQHYTMVFSGNVTGVGKVCVALEHQNGDDKYTDMTGYLNYSGPLEMALAVQATNYTLRISNANLSRNPITLSPGSVLYLATSSQSLPSISNIVFNTSNDLSLPVVNLASTVVALDVGEISAPLRVNGMKNCMNRVTVSSMSYGCAIYDNAFADVLPGVGLTGTVRLNNPVGGILYRLPEGSNTFALGDVDLVEDGEYRVEVSDGIVLTNPPENMRIEVTNGVSATVLTDNTNATVVSYGGTVTLGRTISSSQWERVMLWLDPSKTNSWSYWTYNGNEGYEDLNKYKVVGPWGDWRDGHGDVYLCNDKHYLSVGNTICPFAVTNGLNDMPYISFSAGSRNNTRRMAFYPEGYTNSADNTGGSTSITPRFAIMVFGSQEGGGQAIFGNEIEYYKRGGTLARGMSHTNSIFAKSDIPTWVDGTKVDPSTHGFSGGWQIISVDTSGAPISGIGFKRSVGETAGMSGQNYAEMLFFDKVLANEERIAVERYLAKKWGLEDAYNDTAHKGEISLFGTGTAMLSSAVELHGAFTGTIDLNGQELSFADVELPPSRADVAAIAGCVAWFDPDDGTRISINPQNGGLVRMFDQREGVPVTNGASCLDSVARSPMPVVGMRGCGPVRRWLDYSPSHFPGNKQGKTLRLQHYNMMADAYAVDAVTARTVFLVQDSSKGGGTPFMSTVGDFGSQLSPRLTSYPSMLPDPALPIWRDKSVNTFKNGATYLDGRQTDGSLWGFNARPEVLTAIGGVNFQFGTTGFYQHMEGVAEDIRPDAGEVHGELLVYDREISAADRRKVEAYLMNKWLGTVNEGYGVYTNMTITGAGTVTLASAGHRPKFAAGFVGSITIADDAYAFTIGENGVEDALDFGGGTVSLPASCTLNVTFATAPRAGVYRLISSGGLAASVDWTLNLSCVTGSMRHRPYRLIATDGNVELRVEPKSIMISFR